MYFDLIESLKSDPMPAVDVETRADGSLLGVSFAWVSDGDVQGAYVQLEGEELLRLFRYLHDVKFCAHNAYFDYSVIAKCGAEVQIGFDTYIASLWLWPPHSRDHSLKSLAAAELGVEPWGSAAEFIEEFGSMEGVPIEILEPYAIADAVNTYRLAHEQFIPKISMMKSSLAMNIECALIPVCYQLNTSGVKIDSNALRSMDFLLAEDIKTLASEMEKMAGQKVLINSPKALSKLLFDTMGLVPAGRKTKTGFYSTAHGALEDIADQHPIISKIAELRNLRKLRNPFISNLLHAAAKGNGRAYSKFNPLGTVTGRFSSSSPNLHNLPIRGERGKEIRSVVIAEPGYKLVDVDYSQIQLRILADMSGSTSMRRIYQEGGDIHTETAKGIFRTDNPTKEQRSQCKAINFGFIFGMGPMGLLEYGFTADEARKYYNRFFEVYDGVRDFINRQHQQIWKGVVFTRYGRPCWLPKIFRTDSRKRLDGVRRLSMNYPIQGTEGDLIKIAMIRNYKMIKAKGYDARIVVQIHDELLYEVKECDVDNFVQDLKEQMESIPFSIPLKVEVGVGDNWLECHEG